MNDAALKAAIAKEFDQWLSETDLSGLTTIQIAREAFIMGAKFGCLLALAKQTIQQP